MLSANPGAVHDRDVVFTIVSANYIAFAATLMQSVRVHHPAVTRYIVLVDAPQDFPDIDLAAELLDVRDCAIAGFDNMALWYDVMELNTAVKPSVFLNMFDRGFERVVYLDPDIFVASPLTEIWTALFDHACVLTPHHLRPLQDGRHPDDLAIMKSGVYNLGFLGLRAGVDADGLARWWADRVRTHCRVDIEGNIFTDQRWMDLAPAFVERLLILRHPGCNLAYWNLSQREVAGDPDAGWTVDGRPLVFAHFSGIRLDHLDVFSKHQDRFSRDTLSDAMAGLYADYSERVLSNRWTTTSAIPFGLARLEDGRPVDATMRRCLIRALDDGRLEPSTPVSGAFFDECPPSLAFEPPITRLMHQLWLDREDLRIHFPLSAPDGARAYRDWFLAGGAASAGIHPRSIEAASAAGSPRPPWPAVSADLWSGPSSEVGLFLGQTVDALIGDERRTLPRAVALAWERRPDLRRHFPMNSAAQLDAFLVWCLTYGVTENAIPPAVLPAELYERFAETADAADAQMPMPRGLALTASYTTGRDALPGWENFPQTARSRLSHGLWFCFVAPSLFHWPAIMTAPLRNWFSERSETSVYGFRFSRAAMTYWWLRPDLVERFPLLDEPSRAEFLVWLLVFGLDELGVPLGSFDPELAAQVVRDADGMEGVDWLASVLCRSSRPDLAASFDLATTEGRQGLAAWSRTSLRAEYGSGSLAPVLRPDDRPADTVTVSLALTGTWTSSTGLGEHLRSTAAALRRCGFDDFVEVDIVTGQIRRADGARIAADTAVRVRSNLVHLNAETAAENWTRLRNLGLQAEHSIGWWAWELEALPASWLSAFNYYDEVWGVSAYTADALRQPALRPVRPMLQAIDIPDGLELAGRAELGLDETATIFLFMFDMQSFAARKNPQAVIAAFKLAFPGRHEPARLVIKLQNGAHNPAALAALRASANDPRIEFRDVTTDRNAVLSLVAAADVFVSLHRAEGFGRGPAEAMAMGKPVILTDYSGTRDFADSGNALPVPFSLVPIRPDQYVGVEGQRWAEPDIDAAASHMRWVHLNRDEAARLGERAKAALQTLRPDAVGPRLLEALGLAQAGRVVDFCVPDRRRPVSRRKRAAGA